MKRVTKWGLWKSVCLAALLSLTATAGFAQDAITITQVDPSKFPEMVLYIDAEASSLAAGLTKDDFVVTEDGEPVEIVDFAGEGEERPVDVVFVFDTTSSMGEEIDGAIRSSIAFAEQLRTNHRDFRLGLVAFGDEIRSVYNTDGTMTADAAEFTTWVSELRARGGGDTPELALDALLQATTLHYREDAQKVLLLITDAPPHMAGDGTGYSALTTADVTTQLQDEGFVVYTVAVDTPGYRSLATATGGNFYELTERSDFTGMIDQIGGDIAKQYRLSYLSPRSSYDGTRRNIAIQVGEKAGTEEFLEPHLINIQSSLPIGLALLAALLLALAAPALMSGTPSWATLFRKVPSVREVAAVTPSVPSCPTCGRELRAGARFCGGCGTRI
ncbi:MAG: VWA domain-containing protein [Anaerolineales bacterium]|nr:VWA domain-containing protein [Anaerolineales bacterium]